MGESPFDPERAGDRGAGRCFVPHRRPGRGRTLRSRHHHRHQRDHRAQGSRCLGGDDQGIPRHARNPAHRAARALQHQDVEAAVVRATPAGAGDGRTDALRRERAPCNRPRRMRAHRRDPSLWRCGKHRGVFPPQLCQRRARAGNAGGDLVDRARRLRLYLERGAARNPRVRAIQYHSAERLHRPVDDPLSGRARITPRLSRIRPHDFPDDLERRGDERGARAPPPGADGALRSGRGRGRVGRARAAPGARQSDHL